MSNSSVREQKTEPTTRVTASRRRRKPTGHSLSPLRGEYAVIPFESGLGWMAMAIRNDQIIRLTFGHDDPRKAIGDLDLPCSEFTTPAETRQEWVERLVAFSYGQEDSLLDLPLELESLTSFQKSVTQACREIPYGERRSYGELAVLSGYPRAARAVGSVMRHNRFPLIVPCHRVVGANGGIGGYSANQGVDTKRQLLSMERDSLQRRRS